MFLKSVELTITLEMRKEQIALFSSGTILMFNAVIFLTSSKIKLEYF